MGTYEVQVKVSEPSARVVLLEIVPERLHLDGKSENTITWALSGEGGRFESEHDITFLSESGKNRFKMCFDSATGKITGTVKGEEQNETIYTYWLTVHFPEYHVALRVDPEVDNPPPPPT